MPQSPRPGLTFARQLKWRWKNLRSIFAAPLAYRPGHFYSPVCDPREIDALYRDPAGSPPPLSLPGIQINREAQLALWESWQPFLSDPRPGTYGGRYQPGNDQFGPGDALVLACMLRHVRPRRVIEIGSGNSSAVALDTAEVYLDPAMKFTFIDPFPRRLMNILTAEDQAKHEIVEAGIQYADPARVEALDSGDILFIDSTHIVKTASDVVWDLFELLPRLKSGVYVHFHDMFWPFEYPKPWVVDANMSWNEIYALRAFLSYNDAFEIIFFGDYLWRTAQERISGAAPDLNELGGGLWIRRR